MLIEVKYFESLNNYINAERTNRYKAAKIKKTMTAIYATAFNGIKPYEKPITLTFTWFLKNKRRDLDNIAFNQKFIIDGMVLAKVIHDDSMKYVQGLVHRVVIDTTLENEMVDVQAEYIKECPTIQKYKNKKLRK